MGYEDDQEESGTGWKRWHGRLIAGLLIIGGAVHAVRPAWVTLDWPAIALLLVGILLLFIPLENIGSIVESLEIGRTKILFRKVKQLDDTVNRAVSAEVLRVPQPGYVGAGDQKAGISDSDEDVKENPAGRDAPFGKWLSSDNPRADQHMQLLLQTDKQMALIRIGIEIERALTRLINPKTLNRAIIWSQAIRQLESQGTITPEVAEATIEFRNVRNQIIHPSGGPVPDGVVVSAIDSGRKLLDILTNIEG